MTKYHYGIDRAYGEDVGVMVVYERPTRLRRLLRRLKFDRSTWEWRVKHTRVLPHEVFK